MQRAPTGRFYVQVQHRPGAIYNRTPMPAPSSIDQVTERVERLLRQHEQLRRTNALLAQQVMALTQERDSLKSRLAAARSRVDVLLTRLQSVDPAQPLQASSSAPLAAWGLHDSVDDEAAKDQA